MPIDVPYGTFHFRLLCVAFLVIQLRLALGEVARQRRNRVVQTSFSLATVMYRVMKSHSKSAIVTIANHRGLRIHSELRGQTGGEGDSKPQRRVAPPWPRPHAHRSTRVSAAQSTTANRAKFRHESSDSRHAIHNHIKWARQCIETRSRRRWWTVHAAATVGALHASADAAAGRSVRPTATAARNGLRVIACTANDNTGSENQRGE